MLIFVNLLLLVSAANGARILGVVLTPSYSHQIVFKPLWRELSLRGHQVTVLTSNPAKNSSLTNLTEIDLSVFLTTTRNKLNHLVQTSTNMVYELQEMLSIMLGILDEQFDYPPVKALINDENAKFDLVIAENLWASTLAFAERFNCPLIGMISVDAPNYIYRKMGNPTHSSIYPDLSLPFEHKLSLFERIVSFLNEYVLGWYITKIMQEKEQMILDKHFGKNYSRIEDLYKNMSLLFVNTDPIFHQVRPLVPAIIPIGGGSHRTTPKPLPKELKTVLDQATNGFIYFSLGSNVQSEILPPTTIETIVEVFSELPYTVLWKFGEELPNKPKNVIVSKWLPQEDVLAHPNIKLFITQGGLQSTDEAIYAHVPLLGIPFFGDQPTNVQKFVNKGIGLQLDYKTLTKTQFKETILEVINNPKYRNTVKRLAELAQDQPMKGIDKAVWWTEYVLRHKGAKHLRSPLLDISWCQYLLLDVIGVIIVVLSVLFYIIYLICKIIVRLVKKCCGKSKPKEKKN